MAESELLRIRPPRHRLHPRFILWRTLNTFFWAVAVLGVLGAVWLYLDELRPWTEPVLWFAAVVFLANLLFMPTYRYLVHRWEATDEAVYALSGWISREWRIVPISRVQSIDTVQGPVERICGLATIKVMTASHEGTVKIEGLDRMVAETTVERLNEAARLSPGDAT